MSVWRFFSLFLAGQLLDKRLSLVVSAFHAKRSRNSRYEFGREPRWVAYIGSRNALGAIGNEDGVRQPRRRKSHAGWWRGWDLAKQSLVRVKHGC